LLQTRKHRVYATTERFYPTARTLKTSGETIIRCYVPEQPDQQTETALDITLPRNVNLLHMLVESAEKRIKVRNRTIKEIVDNICSYCRETFEDRQALEEHLRNTLAHPVYARCGIYFVRRACLQ
jgi:hypothetical protein